MSNERFGIDPNALRISMEGMFVKKMMALSGATPEQRTTIEKVVTIFGRHGIGALDAIEITNELAEALKIEE